MYSRFANFHPIVILIYFSIVISLSMFVMHPVFILISLLCGALYSIVLNGIKAIKFNFAFLLPMSLTSVIINILFNNNGGTVIAYLPWNSPITLESVISGFVTAGIISVTICWFSCFNKVMTAEKFIYLFGRKMPSVSLILSMIFRFIPQFKTQFKKTVNAQKCIGYDISNGNIKNKIKNTAKVMSVMTGWALENSIEIADSMKGRGYGLKGKTSFSIYKFQKSDIYATIFTGISFVYILTGILQKRVEYIYYPSVYIKNGATDIFAVYFALCLLPLITEIQENLKWKYYKSKI